MAAKHPAVALSIASSLLAALALSLGVAGCAAPGGQSPDQPGGGGSALSPGGLPRDADARGSNPQVLSLRVAALPLRRVAQRTSQWCWVAATEMILQHVHGNRAAPACGRAGIVFPTWVQAFNEQDASACLRICAACGDPRDRRLAHCVAPGFPELRRNGVAYDITPLAQYETPEASLTWPQLVEQVAPSDGRPAAPVITMWRWTGGVLGHFVVVTGIAEDPDSGEAGRLVLVQDPWPVCEGDTYFMPYEAWVGSTTTDRVTRLTYWNIREDPASPGMTLPQQSPETNPDLAAMHVARVSLPTLPTGPAHDARRKGPPAVEPSARATAARGLEMLKRVASDDRTLMDLGFPDRQALLGARLGEPVWEMLVPQKALAEATSGHPPESLLRPRGWIFPVIPGDARGGAGTAYSAVHIQDEGQGWDIIEMGGQQWLERINEALSAAARQTPPWTRSETFLVSSLALRDHYVAQHDAAGELWLIEIPDAPAIPIAAARRARQVFADRAADARRHGPPPN